MESANHVSVSVLVAAFNVEKYIERCLCSLINQTMKEIEIIIVDDGSTDSTGQICDKFACMDERVRVVHQENRGLPMARKRGLSLAKGDFIKFVDSDDWCEPNMCEHLFEKAIETKADIVFSSAFRHREDGIVKICNLPLADGVYQVRELFDCYILPLFGDLKEDKLITTGYVWCCLFKRNSIQNIEFYHDINLHEDEIIVIQALINSRTIYITEEALYHYNRMGNNTMSKKSCYWEKYWDNIVAVFQAKMEYGKILFEKELDYMPRLVTMLYLKYFRSVRNETHYTNPSKFWGGLKNVYRLKNTDYLRRYKKYLIYQELTMIERLLAKLIQFKIYVIPYFYYAIKCGRMRTFQEKTKN